MYIVKEVKPNGSVIEHENCLKQKTAETFRNIWQAQADHAGNGHDAELRHKGSRFIVEYV